MTTLQPRSFSISANKSRTAGSSSTTRATLDKIENPTWLGQIVRLCCGNSLLRLRGDLGSGKLFTHRSGRVADSLDRACKLLLCYTQMPSPVPYLIFAVEDNLAAITGDACVFHDLFFSGFCCDRSNAHNHQGLLSNNRSIFSCSGHSGRRIRPSSQPIPNATAAVV
jgi:hypothetical protein